LLEAAIVAGVVIIGLSVNIWVLEDTVDWEVVDLVADAGIEALDALDEDADDLVEDGVLLISAGLFLGVPCAFGLTVSDGVIECGSRLEVDFPSLILTCFSTNNCDEESVDVGCLNLLFLLKVGY
jgi:hypothetical protein